MLIGYAKVFTHDQYLDLQKDDINAAGFERIFVDDLSGSTSSRLGLQQAIESVQREDVLVVWRQDRLGRALGGSLVAPTRALSGRQLPIRIRRRNGAGPRAPHRLLAPSGHGAGH